MQSEQIRKIFYDFFTSEPRNHTKIENVSLVPLNDPTILFTNSGMFPLVPYLLGEEHPSGQRLFNFQRCLRTATSDIEEIGDNRHTLMFEMMGNWSLGDYFKKEQISWVAELYIEKFMLDINRIYVTVFGGDEDAPKDQESIDLWKSVFRKYKIEAETGPSTKSGEKKLGSGEEIIFGSSVRIFPYGKDANWWQRGNTPGELGGPDSEIFYDTGLQHDTKFGKYCHVNCDCGRFIEIGNNVFMQYKLNQDMKWEELPQKNIDFGGGFERVVMISQNKTDIFQTDLFAPLIEKLELLTDKNYSSAPENFKRAFRIIADHIRGAVFILADGIRPSNKDQGYILRSLIRRMIRQARILELQENFTVEMSKVVINKFKSEYPHLETNIGFTFDELEKEEINFAKTLIKGLKELQKYTGKGIKIDGKVAFKLYETYGFPIEMISEEVFQSADQSLSEVKKLYEEFNNQKSAHQSQSRKGAEKKFLGGLADTSSKTTALHTAHHLLLASMQNVLGKHVKQKGSNITSERLRIDVSHDSKVLESDLAKIEELVNKKIDENLEVYYKIMPKPEAEKLGAQMEFGQKYGELVKVYFIGNEDPSSIFSTEFCGGPHVESTGELKQFGHFKILSEKSNGAGIRRIKATLL